MFTSASLTDLAERTEYEAWLLETIYNIAEDKLSVVEDGLVYPANGDPPTYAIGGAISIKFFDWGPGFLNAGAPLVFVTAFKILDMLLEWVLVENGHVSTHEYRRKIEALKKPTVTFPPLIRSRPWLRDRLVALYEKFAPLRGTVIHARNFTASNGDLDVSSSKRGVIGPTVRLTAADLRSFAFVAVAALRYVGGAWHMDAFREKRLRFAFDELAPLHLVGTLGQLPAGLAYARVFAVAGNPVEIDLDRIRADITARQPMQDVVFHLRIIAIDSDGRAAHAFLIPSEQLQASRLRLSLNDLAPFSVPLPAKIDVAAAAQALRLIP
jgi:hypothetical protein